MGKKGPFLIALATVWFCFACATSANFDQYIDSGSADSATDASTEDAGSEDPGPSDADREADEPNDADTDDVGPIDAKPEDSGPDATWDADAFYDGDLDVRDSECVGETDSELCEWLGTDCDFVEDIDRCGRLRIADCGTCTAPEVCSGGGIDNLCAAHPPLTGVDGYILGLGRFSITFAVDGLPGSGGFCCASSLEEVRASYPGKNLAWLPTTTRVAPDVVPPLTGVDGYIVELAPGSFRVDFATDGSISGGDDCCSTSVAEARTLHPTKNLVWLR